MLGKMELLLGLFVLAIGPVHGEVFQDPTYRSRWRPAMIRFVICRGPHPEGTPGEHGAASLELPDGVADQRAASPLRGLARNLPKDLRGTGSGEPRPVAFPLLLRVE